MSPTRILAAVAGASVDPDVVRLAVTLAAKGRAEVAAVHVIEVRWDLPLDARLDAQLERGEQILADAARIGEAAGLTIETELLQARDAAAAIVDTAGARGADLIVLGMPYRRRLGRVYIGKTVQRVYLTAACAVLAYRQEAPQ